MESERYSEKPAEPVEPFVGLNISKNNKPIDTVALKLLDSYILPDGELKVTAKELPSGSGKEWLYESYSPWAVIEIKPRGKPELEVLVATDEDKYISSTDAEIVATVQLENTGSADAVNVDMKIETELPVKRGTLSYHYDRIKKNEAITETIIFSSPQINEYKLYEILANVSGYDVKDIRYSANHQIGVAITFEPEESLTIRKNVNGKMYLKDSAMVSISIKNNGNEEIKNVSIADAIPKGFKLIGNKTLKWIVDIPAGGEWEYRYLVKPTEANKDGVVFPSATANFKKNSEWYGVRSNQPKVRVNGPKIMLLKQSNVSEIELNETVNFITVTIIAENTGNTPTKVFIEDKLPENAFVLNGSTAFEDFLEAGKKTSFNYSTRIDSAPPITLPPATADFYELGTKGLKISTNSPVVVIGSKILEIEPTPTPEMEQEVNITETPVNESYNVTDLGNVTNQSNFSRQSSFDKILNFIFGCNETAKNESSFYCDLFSNANEASQ